MGFRNKWLVLVFAFVATTGSLLAQGTTGTLTGTVTQSGNPLPGVTVVVTSPNLQGQREDITNEAGGYNFSALPPGDYTVRFTLEGMLSTSTRVKVGVAQNARGDHEMQLAAVSEAITVTSAAPSVAETTEVTANFTSDLVEELPIARTIAGITGLAPGVTAGVNGFQISGGQSYDNLYTVNGAVIQENLRGQPFALFIEDAIQETTVQTAGVSAEFGNFTGGVVNAITKSGGNDFSGSIRDSLTNPNWTERSPDVFQVVSGSPAGVKVAENIDVLNQVYEGTIGGRVIRDRLWFFGAGRHTKNDADVFLSNAGAAYVASTTDQRYEAKLTAALSSRHNVVGSYFSLEQDQVNNCQQGCYDLEAVDTDIGFPTSFISAYYDGVITNDFLLGVKYTGVNFKFRSLGGDDQDLFTGTPIALGAPGFSTYTNAPPFCGYCTDDERNNNTLGIKGTYYLGTRALGSHNIVAGAERFHEERIANNSQSPSAFRLISSARAPVRAANGQTLISFIPGSDSIVWFPINEASSGSDLNTTALYINDKWDLNSRWSFNLGARLDSNDSKDASGNVAADDSKISPRLGASYDVFADSRLRLNASYGSYVGRLSENVAGSQATAGTPAIYQYRYEGPEILNQPTAEAARLFFQWFNANGGTSRSPIFASIPGFTTRLDGTLKSPSVDEWTVGVATTFSKAFLRADYIRRDWKDFYGGAANRQIGTVTSPAGTRTDLVLVGNTNDPTRNYSGVDLQGAYRISNRFRLGGNYTWSELKGNLTGENVGAGPFATITKDHYPEYLDYSWNVPEGYLSTDQTHKLRAWVTYDLPTVVGNFNLSLLQRLDSGSPYQFAGTIDLRPSANFYGPGQPGGIANPGGAYASPIQTATYFFSERGAFRFEDLTATDLAINYNTNPGWLAGNSLFVQGELINAFNENAIVATNTGVLTSLNDSTLKRFNPMAGDVPVEGVHWRKGPLFGLPTASTNAATAGHFQLPRTYRVSVGVRF